jgi:hypothetical protein
VYRGYPDDEFFEACFGRLRDDFDFDVEVGEQIGHHKDDQGLQLVLGWGMTTVLQVLPVRFHGCYRGVTRVLQGYYKIVTRVLQACNKSVKRALQGCCCYRETICEGDEQATRLPHDRGPELIHLHLHT